jgi:hypothetical protein
MEVKIKMGVAIRNKLNKKVNLSPSSNLLAREYHIHNVARIIRGGNRKNAFSGI